VLQSIFNFRRIFKQIKYFLHVFIVNILLGQRHVRVFGEVSFNPGDGLLNLMSSAKGVDGLPEGVSLRLSNASL